MANVFEDWASKCDDLPFRLAMIQVYDELWTAQVIVEARFGKASSKDPSVVLPVLTALREEHGKRKKSRCGRGGEW